MPEITLNSVVFPAPFPPRRLTTSPHTASAPHGPAHPAPLFHTGNRCLSSAWRSVGLFLLFLRLPLQSGNGIVIIFLDKISAIPDRQRTGHIPPHPVPGRFLPHLAVPEASDGWDRIFQFMSRLSRRLHKKEFSLIHHGYPICQWKYFFQPMLR